MQGENISTPIYVECDKMHQSKVCIQEFLCFVSGLDIQLDQSKNNSPVRKKNQLQLAKYGETYTGFFKQLIQTNGLVVKVSSSESGNLGSIPDES